MTTPRDEIMQAEHERRALLEYWEPLSQHFYLFPPSGPKGLHVPHPNTFLNKKQCTLKDLCEFRKNVVDLVVPARKFLKKLLGEERWNKLRQKRPDRLVANTHSWLEYEEGTGDLFAYTTKKIANPRPMLFPANYTEIQVANMICVVYPTSVLLEFNPVSVTRYRKRVRRKQLMADRIIEKHREKMKVLNFLFRGGSKEVQLRIWAFVGVEW